MRNKANFIKNNFFPYCLRDIFRYATLCGKTYDIHWRLSLYRHIVKLTIRKRLIMLHLIRILENISGDRCYFLAWNFYIWVRWLIVFWRIQVLRRFRCFASKKNASLTKINLLQKINLFYDNQIFVKAAEDGYWIGQNLKW